MEQATFGAGCFWGVEAAFRQLPGVIDVEVGYTGGTVENPSYQQVCTDTTGHAEVVRVTYDPKQLSYNELLQLFWVIHNPTMLNRQGPDIGSQYRSVIFYHSSEQQKLAELSKEILDTSDKYSHLIVTAIEPVATFYRAEEYHQQYYAKQGISTCCVNF